MTLAIFDLDHTLINGDSDYLWGEYMVANHIVDKAEYQRANKAFLRDYQRGQLDNDSYLEFALRPLTQHSVESLYRWRADYVENIGPAHYMKGKVQVDGKTAVTVEFTVMLLEDKP